LGKKLLETEHGEPMKTNRNVEEARCIRNKNRRPSIPTTRKDEKLMARY
jgi:hypothetical protein